MIIAEIYPMNSCLLLNFLREKIGDTCTDSERLNSYDLPRYCLAAAVFWNINLKKSDRIHEVPSDECDRQVYCRSSLQSVIP
jgi:hypothetical protein